jgi:hypothetical protein
MAVKSRIRQVSAAGLEEFVARNNVLFVKMRHPGEGRDPEIVMTCWIPAFAGMTVVVVSGSSLQYCRQKSPL